MVNLKWLNEWMEIMDSIKIRNSFSLFASFIIIANANYTTISPPSPPPPPPPPSTHLCCVKDLFVFHFLFLISFRLQRAHNSTAWWCWWLWLCWRWWGEREVRRRMWSDSIVVGKGYVTLLSYCFHTISEDINLFFFLLILDSTLFEFAVLKKSAHKNR